MYYVAILVELAQTFRYKNKYLEKSEQYSRQESEY